MPKPSRPLRPALLLQSSSNLSRPRLGCQFGLPRVSTLGATAPGYRHSYDPIGYRTNRTGVSLLLHLSLDHREVKLAG